MPQEPSYKELQKRVEALEEKTAELEEKNQTYLQLLENLHHVLYTLDQNARITFISPNVERLSGFGPETLVGREFMEALGPRGGAANPDGKFQRVLSGEEVRLEYPYVTRSMEVLWVLTKALPIFDKGEVVGVQGILLDISEQKEQEEALRQSERKFREIFNNTSDGICIHDMQGRILEANQVLCDRLGYAREELLGMRSWRLNAGQDPEAVTDRLKKMFEKEDVFFETFSRRKDGSAYPVEIHSRKIEYEGKTCFLCVSRDVSERLEKQMEYAQILNTSIDGFWVLDLDGAILEVNPAVANMLGYTRNEITRLNIADIEVKEDLENTSRQMGDLKKAGYLTFETRHRHKDGGLVDVEVSASYLPVGNGRVVAFTRDITERKRIEASLNFQSLLLGRIQDCVTATDLEGNIIYVNDAEMQRTGRSRQELIGRPASICGEDPARDAPPQEIIENTLANGQWHGEVVDFSRTGETVFLECRTQLIRDENGTALSIVRVASDVTEKKRLEEERRRLEEQFQQAQKMESIGRLAGGVAHDLNNLLSPILGYGEMLIEDTSLDDPRRGLLEEVVSAGKRAQSLVRQLLAFSRKQSLQFQTIDINSRIQDFRKLLRRTVREDIKIETRLDPSIPRIKGDIGQLEQVILNLAVNAQDAMPEGGTLTLETSAVELDAAYAGRKKGVTPGAYVRVAISDTGTGMDDETLEHLFEPFFTTKETGKGTGLGMSTAYGIVKQHGGNIWAYSEPGLGTTIKVYLPVSEPSVETEAPSPQEAAEAKGSEVVLLVEDDRQVRNLSSVVLERYGYQVLAARNGAEAISLVENRTEEAPDLLLTDVIMPDMNGKELFERISSAHPGLRVLYMSGYTDEVIAHHGVIDENINFLEKPFAVRALTAKVREALDK